jgi:threonine/homoserine/homoserine lactone efflux protein
MNTENLIAFAVFALVSSLTPGPNNTMLLASGVNFGFRRSQRHMWGVNLGFAFMLLCVGLGMHSVMSRIPIVYDVLRYLGSAYLLWMAWKLATTRAVATASSRGNGTDGPQAQPMGFFAAAAFQWVNPKAWVMAVTCMSTYLSANAGAAQVALLAGQFMMLGAPCSAFWVGCGQAMRGLLQDPVRLRIFNITMALALVASLYPLLLNAQA